MNYAPLARILLRYIAGGGIFGNEAIGEALSTNPDVVLIVSIILGAAVESFYAFAKRKGWNT